MIELDDVLAKIEPVELSPEIRQMHLARLHALQAVKSAGGIELTNDHHWLGSTRTRRAVSGGLAAAAVAVVVTASALIVSNHHEPAASTQAAAGAATTTSTRAPASTSPAVHVPAGSAAVGLSDAQFSKQLAQMLGLSLDRANVVATELDALAKNGSIDAASAQFSRIAAGAGVTPDRLAAAVDEIKKAAAGASAANTSAQPRDAAGLSAKSAAAAVKGTGQHAEQNLLTSTQGIGALATALHLSRAKATELAGRLVTLQNGGGLDPESAAFRGIAQDFGLTAEQLAGAIGAVKASGR